MKTFSFYRRDGIDDDSTKTHANECQDLVKKKSEFTTQNMQNRMHFK